MASNIPKITHKLIGPLFAMMLALPAAILPVTPVAAATQVNLILEPAAQTIHPGDIFDVLIQARSGSQEVVGVDAFLDFDPSKLAVVDMDPGTAGTQISGGTVLTVPLWNNADNIIGYIDYSAGALNPYPSGAFTIASIRFQSLTTASETTAVTFSTSLERPTLIVGDVQAAIATGNLAGAVYTINPGFTPPSSSGGGSGGGGRRITVTLSGLSATMPLLIDSDGVAQNTARLATADGHASLTIVAGTTLTNSRGNPLSLLTAQTMVSPPAPPAGDRLISAYTFGPSGAAFKPAIVLTLLYSPAELPEDVSATSLYIAFYEGTSWIAQESTVDSTSGTVSVKIDHFSSFALIGKPGVEATLAPQPSPVGDTTRLDEIKITPSPAGSRIPLQSPAAVLTPAQSEKSDQAPAPEPDQAKSLNLTVIILLVVIALVIIGTIVLILVRRRSSRT